MWTCRMCLRTLGFSEARVAENRLEDLKDLKDLRNSRKVEEGDFLEKIYLRCSDLGTEELSSRLQECECFFPIYFCVLYIQKY